MNIPTISVSFINFLREMKIGLEKITCAAGGSLGSLKRCHIGEGNVEETRLIPLFPGKPIIVRSVLSAASDHEFMDRLENGVSETFLAVYRDGVCVLGIDKKNFVMIRVETDSFFGDVVGHD